MLTDINDYIVRFCEKSMTLGLGFDEIRTERELAKIEDRELNELLQDQRPMPGEVTEGNCIRVMRPSMWTTFVLGFVISGIYLAIGFATAIVLIGAIMIGGTPFIMPLVFMMRAGGMFDMYVLHGQCPRCNSKIEFNIRKDKVRDTAQQGMTCSACSTRIVVKPPYFWIPEKELMD